MLTGLHHVQWAMPKSGESRARAFYGELLDIPARPQPVELPGTGGRWSESEAVRVHLGVEDDFRPVRKADPAFQSGDFDKLMEKLENAGYLVHSAGAIDRHARFLANDPFGNRMDSINVESEL